MKKFTLSVAVVMALSTFAMAGGDIQPVVEPEVVVPEVVAPVVDDSGFYIGGAYSMANFTEDYDNKGMFSDRVGTYEEDYNAIMLQAGYKINKYFAVEGRYWTSVGDVDWSNKGEEIGMSDGPYNDSGTNDNELTAWGIYVKPMYPVTDAFDIYALLGYGAAEADIEGENTDSLDGFSWGIGVAYSFTDNVAVFVDYVELYNDDGSFDDIFGIDTWEETIYTVNLGVTYKF